MSNLLVHSPADIARYAAIQGSQGITPPVPPNVAANLSWPIYATKEPDRPDEVITTYDTTGIDEGRSQPTGEIFSQYGVQWRIRGANQRIARQKAESLRIWLSETLYNSLVTIDGTQYLVQCFSNIGQLLDLKEIPNTKRRIFTINCTITIRRLN